MINITGCPGEFLDSGPRSIILTCQLAVAALVLHGIAVLFFGLATDCPQCHQGEDRFFAPARSHCREVRGFAFRTGLH